MKIIEYSGKTVSNKVRISMGANFETVSAEIPLAPSGHAYGATSMYTGW